MSKDLKLTTIPPYKHMKIMRISYGWSQRILARRMGVATNTIALWERGEREMPKIAVKLLQYLDLDPNIRRPDFVEVTKNGRVLGSTMVTYMRGGDG